MNIRRRKAVAAGLFGALLLPVAHVAIAQTANDDHAAHHSEATTVAAKPDAGQHAEHGMSKMLSVSKADDHGAMPAMQAKGDAGPSSAAFKAINNKMHEDMAITFTGDADVDFVRGMIPHHQAAIDMAKVVIGFGKDPEVRKLAEAVIKAQDGEIAMMKDWLAKNAK